MQKSQLAIIQYYYHMYYEEISEEKKGKSKVAY